MASSGIQLPFVKVIIVGAGLGGLTMSYRLKKQLNCHDFVIYDRATGFGGTWLANTYPGCGVDIPAMLYSLSFAPNPDFSSLFPKQEEVLRYINSVATRFNVDNHLVSRTEWLGATWQDDTRTWLVKLKDLNTLEERTQECQVLISAVGGLTNPNQLDIPGVERFQGDIIHTAEWDHSVSLDGKKVVVIGNGASATQLIPAIAKRVDSIVQFMRTPQYYLPSSNTQINPFWRAVFNYVPGVHYLVRLLTFLYLETSTPQFNLTKTGAKMREETLQISRRYIRECAPEKYRSLLIPNAEVGCKRRVFDHDGYISCLNLDHVHLTNEPIVGLDEHSVLTKSGGKYHADVIVLANGFSLTQFDVEVQGRYGRSRREHWKDFGYIEAFNTVAMSGFPNFFYILGPNSGRGHTSIVYSLESYTNLIIRIIKPIIMGSALSVEPKLSSETKYNERLHRALEKTVFTHACRSWYIDDKTSKNWAIYPWSSFQMWHTTHIAGLGDWVYEFADTRAQNWGSAVILCIAVSAVTIAILALGLYEVLISVVMNTGSIEYGSSSNRSLNF